MSSMRLLTRLPGDLARGDARGRARVSPGPQRVMARATEAGGAAQPEKATWNPSGYFWNGWHEVAWEVVA